MYKLYPDRILKRLANLQLAISFLLAIGIIVAIGTVIEQDQSLNFYQQNYPASRPIFGFLTWEWIIFFNLDHVYTSYGFIFTLVIFSLSLFACTLTIQLPVLRRLRQWKFSIWLNQLTSIRNVLPRISNNVLLYKLHLSNYNIFRQGKKNYAYTGLLGRVGPIVVHTSIILLLAASSLGSFSGYTAQQVVPRGEFFHLQNLIKFGSLARISSNISWRVNDFWITYTEEFKTNQFYSDLSLLDNFGNELKRKTVFVNEPLVYKGITLYQTDWDILGLKFQLSSSNQTSQLSLKKLTKNGQKFWFGSLNIPTIASSTSLHKLSIVLSDLRGLIYLYDENGVLITECKLGEFISLTDTQQLRFLDFLTSTGLQAKLDPGLKTVYFSFFLLILSTYASFISYSQIWGNESIDTNTVVVSGTSNRAVLLFQGKLRQLLEEISL